MGFCTLAGGAVALWGITTGKIFAGITFIVGEKCTLGTGAGGCGITGGGTCTLGSGTGATGAGGSTGIGTSL